MKKFSPRSVCRRHALRAAGALVSLLLLNQTASAVDGTWNVDANGTWSTASNWLNNIIADGAGSTANFTFDITADRTVSLDSSRTIGNLVFGDANTIFNWTLNNNATPGNILTLQTAAGLVPTINTGTLTGKSAFIQLVLAGNQGMTKLGANTLNLQGINTYTGTTLVDAGTLTLSNSVTNATSTGSIASTQITVRGLLNLDNGLVSGTTVNRIADNATVTLTGGPAGGNAFSLAINPGSASTLTETVGTIAFSNGYSAISMTAAGAETGSSARSGRLAATTLTRVGAATSHITATNLGTNTAQTAAGRLTGDSTGLGLIGTSTATSGPGTVTNLKVIPWLWAESGGAVAAEAAFRGTALTTYDTSTGVRVLGPSETTTFANIGATTDTNVREVTTGAAATITLNADTVVNSVQLYNPNANAGGNLTLDLGGRTLRIGSGSLFNFSTGSNSIIVQNGTLTAGTAAGTDGELIFLAGGTGTNTLAATAIVANNGAGITSLTLGGTRGLTLAANNTFTGALNVSISTGSTATLSGTNTFTAANVYSGTLVVSNAGTFNGTPLVAINRGASVNLPNTVGATTTIQGLNDVDGGGTISNVSGGTTGSNRTLALSGSGTYSFSGVIQNQSTGAATGTGISLSKTGTGTQTLSGINTYTGTTSVTGGTLLVNGNSSAATGAVTVGTGGTLGGTGTIGGATTVNGTLQVGANSGTGSTPGLLTFSSSVALTGSSLFDVNAAGARGTAYDALTAGGALTYGGTLNVSLNGYTPANGSMYDLFDFGSQSGTFSSIVVSGGSYTGALDYSTGILTLSATAVPEPSTWMAGCLCLVGLAVYHRRRRAA